MASERFVKLLATPLGTVYIGSDGKRILDIKFLDGEIEEKENGHPLLESAAKQLQSYFDRELDQFDLPLAISNGTDHQQKVWITLKNLPFSKTMSYLDLARQLGDEKSIRAVANANARNPFAIVIPCHRIIGSDGSLTGYAGGLWRKKWLLEHEQDAHQGTLFA